MSEKQRYTNEPVRTAHVVQELEKARLYLTFDDGPKEGTPEVLDVLKAESVKATFFMNAKSMIGNPARQYKLVRRMIEEGHALADHGYDHEPMTRDIYKGKPGYKQTPVSEVKEDFTRNLSVFQKLFTDNNDEFPGFVAARLPGDGRTLPNFVKMITDEVKLPHVAWGTEFAPVGNFKPRVKQELLPLEEIKPDDSTEEQAQKQQKNARTKQENAQIKEKNDKNRDFYRDWLPGVLGTLPPGQWPPADHIVLLHDGHWDNKMELLQKVIQKLKERRTITHLVPLPLHKDIKVVGGAASSMKAPEKKSEEAGVKPKAEQFFVQIASMSSESAAAEVKAEAIATGYANTTVRAKDKLWRVLIGPYDSRQAAQAASVDIKKKFTGAFTVQQ